MKTKVNHAALSTEISDQPAIYVGTYAKYNNGSIEGAWVDMTEIEDKEDFLNLCRELHSDEEDPEFMFQDWQSIRDKFIGESWLSDEYFKYLENRKKIEEDGYKVEAYEAYIKGSGNTDVNDFKDAYQGEYDSDEDFAEQIAEGCGMINEKLSWPYTCID